MLAGLVVILMAPLVISGCGSSGSLSMVGSSRGKNSYLDFKEAVQRRMVYALDTEFEGFELDFDAALTYVETGSDLRLRKLFLDTIGEVQLSLNDEEWAKDLANRKAKSHVTPLWYMGVPVKLLNLIAGSALLRKAGIAMEDPSRSGDHSILLRHAQAVLSTNMYRPDSPYDITFLVHQALRACARIPSTLKDNSLNKLKRKEVSSCNKFGLESVISIWTLGVVSPRLTEIPLVTPKMAKRINWLVPIVHALGDFDTHSLPRLVMTSTFVAMRQASCFLFFTPLHRSTNADLEVFPSDVDYFPQLMKDIDIAENCFPHFRHYKDMKRSTSDSKLDALLQADPQTRAFVSRLDL
jgi:hypothetical protein